MTSQARIAELRRSYEAKHAFATQVRARNNPSTRQKLESAEKLIRFLENTEGDKDTSKEGSDQAQLRDRGSNVPKNSEGEYSNLENDFESLYYELLKQNTDASGDLRPSPWTEAWMELASLLRMRNRYLEHQVKELKEENDSLGEDVTWHLEQLRNFEQDLKEAQADRAIALAGILDLKVEIDYLAKYRVSSCNEMIDERSIYTDMTSSAQLRPLALRSRRT